MLSDEVILMLTSEIQNIVHTNCICVNSCARKYQHLLWMASLPFLFAADDDDSEFATSE